MENDPEEWVIDYKLILVNRIYKKSNFGVQLTFQKGPKNNIENVI